MTTLTYIPFCAETFNADSILEDYIAEYEGSDYIRLNRYKRALQYVALAEHRGDDVSKLCLKMKITACDYKYIYPLYIVSPYLVDIESVITEHGLYPLMGTIAKFLNTGLHLSVIDYITKLDLTKFDDMTKTNILKELAISESSFLLSVFDVHHLAISPDVGDVIKSSPLLPKVTLPAQILGKFPKYYDNLLKENTYGLLTNFPWNAAALAGGFIEKILSETITQCQYSDIDVWVIGDTHSTRKKNLKIVLDHIISIYGADRIYMVSRRSVIDIYVEDIPRIIQVISNDKTNLYGTISRFDYAHISFGYIDGVFYGTLNAITAIKTRRTHIVVTSNIQQLRIIKSLMCNYEITTSPTFTNEDLLVVADDKQCLRLVMSVISDWCPKSMPDATPEYRRLYNTAMIVRDKNIEVTDYAHILENTVVGGVFDNYMHIESFMDVNVSNLTTKRMGYNLSTLINGDHQLIIRSDNVTIVDVNSTDPNHVIVIVSLSDNFTQFRKAIVSKYNSISKKNQNDVIDTNLRLQLPYRKLNYVVPFITLRNNDPSDASELRLGAIIQITSKIMFNQGAYNINRSVCFDLTHITIITSAPPVDAINVPVPKCESPTHKPVYKYDSDEEIPERRPRKIIHNYTSSESSDEELTKALHKSVSTRYTNSGTSIASDDDSDDSS